ncbi:Hypothetical protein PBC10988_6500 [Planctomycetales bacterium 10988]|nr:Hypothetical protein PBC10988_6500 [Planctomycetales bacterium 10988]
MTKQRIGFLGNNISENLELQEELHYLNQKGLPLAIASLKGETAINNRDLNGFHGRVTTLSSTSLVSLLFTAMMAPVVFKARFFTSLVKAMFMPTTNWGAKFQLFGSLFPAMQLAWKWKSMNLTHVHAEDAEAAGTVALHISELLGTGYSFTQESTNQQQEPVAMEWKMQAARFVVCRSTFHEVFCRSFTDMEYDMNRTQVVYPGVDLSEFAPESEELQHLLNESDKPTILAVSDLVEEEGLLNLILACGILKERGVDFQCIIAGEGRMETTLMWHIAQQKLQDDILLTAQPVDAMELPYLMQSATVLVAPTVALQEGCTLPLPPQLIQAAACGVPCVSTNLASIPEVVQHGFNGKLVGAFDVRKLADTLEGMFEDRESLVEMGQSARQWAEENFDKDQAFDRMKDLFKFVLETPGTAAPEFHFQGVTPRKTAPVTRPKRRTALSLVATN